MRNAPGRPEAAREDGDGHSGVWRSVFAVGDPTLQRYQSFNMRLPAPPRCRLCYAPYRGLGGALMRLQGRGPSSRNPHYCSRCDGFLRGHPGGAVVPMTVMFVDVRGSTRLAAERAPQEFSRVMRGFYGRTLPVVYAHDGFVHQVYGDGVLALWPPGFCGPDHAAKAIGAARALLGLSLAAPDGAPVRFGIGLDTGPVYVGAMTGADTGVEEITAQGAPVNRASHLCAACEGGQALLSAECATAAGPAVGPSRAAEILVKGSDQPVPARVLE